MQTIRPLRASVPVGEGSTGPLAMRARCSASGSAVSGHGAAAARVTLIGSSSPSAGGKAKGRSGIRLSGTVTVTVRRRTAASAPVRTAHWRSPRIHSGKPGG
jgi:hypothetical protein